jgi:hypothetical protein
MSRNRPAVVITSIAAPNGVLRRIAADCIARNIDFHVIGDTKSPKDFALDGCRFLGIDQQRELGFAFAERCPTKHYARKNIGYLIAAREGASYILETDDDNMPSEAFYEPLPVVQELPSLTGTGWTNVYRYFTDELIWPRGLPLNEIKSPVPALPAVSPVRVPIQQGLADENPDVDAIYRLALPLPFHFEHQLRLALGQGAWCPFNSQNTVFYPEAYPLLYLPAYCSFRMTDIWRSFVAQRIAWANGWSILFREATVVQDRNDHSLMRDFEDEISGYLGNRDIAIRLDAIAVTAGAEHIPDAMRACYRTLIEGKHVGAEEMELLDSWLADLASIATAR